MAKKQEETASFMIRFTQMIFHSEDGEPQVQWRGNIRHIQGGEEKRFSQFDDVVTFIQSKLQDLTLQAMENKTPEEQKGILAKSFDIWKKMASEAPKMVVETLKDPKKQVAHIQDQIQDQVQQVRDDINQKLEASTWIGASKADKGEIIDKINALSEDVLALSQKIDKLSNKLK